MSGSRASRFLRRVQRLALATSIVCAITGAVRGEEAPVAFDTAGGEAWSFDKLITATVPAGACDEVAFTSPRASVLARPQGARVMAWMPLDAGSNVVAAECRKAGARNGRVAEQQWRVRLRDVPKAFARARVGESGVTLSGAASELAPARAAPLVRFEWRAREGNPAPLAGLPAEGREIALTAPTVNGEYYVTLRVTDALGRSDESMAAFRVRGGKAESVDLARDYPAWIDRAIVYGVVPSRFGPRGLVDVMARLPELAALGVTTLWIAPVTATPPNDFGYAVVDYFGVRSDFGSEADLRALIAAAHRLGLKVIIDFVPNHLSIHHPYFVNAAANARVSPYYDFFDRSPAGEPAHYFDWPHLKNLNFDNPEVRRLVTEAFAHWVREFDVDGFRVDVAWGPRDRAPEFWPRWRDELKRIKPDLFLLAEASARDLYYVTHGFDAAYDWTDRLGQWAWHDAFDDVTQTVPRLRAALSHVEAHPESLTMRFLNNNDTGARFVTRHGPALTRVATAMLFTLPGIPSLYSGDEVGAEYEPYKGGPPIAWNDPHGLAPWHAQLIALRQTVPALRGRALRLLELAPADKVLAYLRPGASARESVLVLLNYGAAPTRVAVPGEVLRALGSNGPLIDLMTGEELEGGVRLPAQGVRVLKADRPSP